MTMRVWRRTRQVVQALALVLFVLLVIYTLAGAQTLLPTDTLLRLDPLAALAAMLSTRSLLLARFWPALLVVAVTLALGRVWCGWLCPLGTLIEWCGPRQARDASPRSRWRSAKTVLLFTLLLGALWGSLTLMALDPLTVFIRSLSALLLPALSWLIVSAERALYPFALVREPLVALDTALRGTLLSYKQPYYAGGLLLVAFLGGLLGLSWLARRAWCRYLCPLGGLLALLSKVSWLKRRVSTACVSCGACARVCPMGTVDAQKGYASDAGECTLCLDCAPACPKAAISFGGPWQLECGQPYNPSRRQALAALGLSVGGLALLRVAPAAHHPAGERLRPPGVEEEQFLAACIRCGMCVKVCPTHGLQPSLTQSGLEGLWTPILAPRLGPCDYACTACGDTCPTGAIPKLALEEKRLTVIGKAIVDPAVCIPWANRGECIVCEEMCPLPQKAITLVERETVNHRGEKRILQAPVVDPGLCIGCGLCESKCPVLGEAAIRVRVDPMG